jgi:hypothetical protein
MKAGMRTGYTSVASDYAAGAEIFDVGVAVAQFFQDRVGVLTEHRSPVTEATRRLGKIDGGRRQGQKGRRCG